MAGAVCIGVGVFALLVGLFLSIGGPLLIPNALHKAQTKAINEYVVVDSTDSPTYDDWAGGYDRKMDYQMVFYMWNLTNADDVRVNTSAVPSYESVGPYVYRRLRASVNVSFPDNGNQVEYYEYDQFVFDYKSSKGQPDDLITNINPVYLAVLSQTGNEAQMMVAMASFYMLNGVKFLTGDFIPLYSIYVSPQFLLPAMNATLIALQTKYTPAQAYSIFLSTWANATKAPTVGEWTGLLLSEPSNISSNISMEAAQAMFNPDDAYSLLSTDPQVAYQWAEAVDTPSYADVLVSHYNITHAQLKTVLNWRTKYFAEKWVHPSYIRQYNLTDITDLGWVQWFDGTPLDGQSTCDVWTLLNCPVEWEWFLSPLAGENYYDSWQFSKKVMDPKIGLLNPTIFQEWLLAQTSGVTNFNKWGLSYNQSSALFSYTIVMAVGAAPVDLQARFGPSAGLIRTKSVDSWVINCEDYIQDALQPGSPSCGLIPNATVEGPNLIYSGKDDINKINKFIKWRGMTEIVGMWNGTVKVDGNSELGQFTPAVEQSAKPMVFDDDFVRPLTFTFNTTTSLQDINVYRYHLDWKEITAPSDVYYQKLEGLVNATAINQAPIFFSLYDMKNVSDDLSHRVKGMVTNYTDEEQYNTVLYIEPISGSTVGIQKRVQVNLYIAPNTTYFKGSPFKNNLPTGLLYPIARVGESFTISGDSATTLKNKLKLVPEVQRDSFYVSLTIGPALIVAGVAMIVIGIRRRRNAEYSQIQ